MYTKEEVENIYSSGGYLKEAYCINYSNLSIFFTPVYFISTESPDLIALINEPSSGGPVNRFCVIRNNFFKTAKAAKDALIEHLKASIRETVELKKHFRTRLDEIEASWKLNLKN